MRIMFKTSKDNVDVGVKLNFVRKMPVNTPLHYLNVFVISCDRCVSNNRLKNGNSI